MTCAICATAEIPQNETLKIDGKIHCNSCMDQHFPHKSDWVGREVLQEFDPTICTLCEQDFGRMELQKRANYPICEPCDAAIEKKILPLWVKGFFAGLTLLIFVGFAINWRFIIANQNLKKSNAFFAEGKVEEGNKLMIQASELVPESADLSAYASYTKGIDLLTNDHCAEALLEFRKAYEFLPVDYNVESYMVQAEMGAAYDEGDYEGFLNAAFRNLSLDSTQASAYGSVSSAFACIYAKSGDEKAKTNSLYYLSKANAIDSVSPESIEYRDRIHYRLDSRKIIDREAFLKLFPKGYTQ